jgi:predicted AAA+ superfamily ATPase
LFGARGTGKTTLLHQIFNPETACFIDLLDPFEEDKFARDPSELDQRIAGLPLEKEWVIIDEIQRVPRLLDMVHLLIEKTNRRFVMTGSSGRKLKRGASNLLAGRAFVYNLFPLTSDEMGESVSLEEVLLWGTLPKIRHYTSDDDKKRYLQAYALTYLKEEIVAEQVVRRLDPFRHFLEVAAQSNGKIINFSNIARDTGVDTKTVQTYFMILEDTLVGHLLPAYHTSIRKRQRHNPKFYFFDTGVKRALDRTLDVGIKEGTFAFGEAFEHFIILELIHLSRYANNDWSFSYLNTKDGAEIDCIIDRPGMPKALIEIKSASSIHEKDVAIVNRFALDMKPCEAFCISRDPHVKKIGLVRCLPWREAIKEIGL